MIGDDEFDNFDFYLKGIHSERCLLEDIRKRKSELDGKLKSLSWKDIVIEKQPENGSNSEYYEVSFGAEISGAIAQIENIIESLKHLDTEGKAILYGVERLDFRIVLAVSKLDNRVDVQDSGLPHSIQGLGLGTKIYRSLVSLKGYLLSRDHQLSGQGRLLWNSLRRNPEFYTFFTKHIGLCFSSETPEEKILQTLEDVIPMDYPDELLIDPEFISKESKLFSQTRFSNMI